MDDNDGKRTGSFILSWRHDYELAYDQRAKKLRFCFDADSLASCT